MHNIEIDFSRNPELAEVFSRKKPGDKCRMEVEFQVNELDVNYVRGTINEISPHGYEPTSPDKSKDIVPETDEPVAITMKAHKGKGGKSASESSY